MATINISYSGTNLKFCDGTQAINGNGWYGPTTVEVDENNDTIVEVELELVYGTLVATPDGEESTIISVDRCIEQETDSCCNHVSLDFQQWMINFEYYDGEE